MKKIFGFAFILIIVFSTGCEKVTEFAVVTQEVTLSHDTIVIRQNETKNLGIFVNAGFLNYVVDNSTPGLQIYPQNGTIQASNAGNFSLTYAVAQTIESPITTKISVKTSAGNFDVVVIVLPTSSAAVSPSFINLSKQNTKGKLYLSNSTLSKQQFQVSTSENYISFDVSSGVLNIGETRIVNVSFDPNNLPDNSRETSKIIVKIDNQTFPVDMAVSTLVTGLKLSGDLIDGQYSQSLKKFYYVSSKPKGISSFDPETKTTNFVSLPYVPICMTLSLDGKKAAIGYDANVTYFDIENMQILKNFSVDCKVIDIVLAPNNYIYSFPERDQWSSIRCTKISNGFTTNSQYASIYAGSKAELHPSGKWIYVLSTNLSPNDVHKFDISSGTAEKLYDSPYHGTYNLGDNVIINPIGDKLYSLGTFLSCNESQNLDLLYRGQLEKQLFSKYAFFHPVLDELFLVSQYSNWQSPNTNNKILRVDAASFEVKSTSITDDIIDADGNPNLSIPIIAWVHNDELFYVAHNEGKTIYEVNSFKL
jgi:hypothetical protein